MPERPDERLLLTYAELGVRLGISPDGARMRAKREHRRHERNDPSGPVRVRVPAVALPEHPPERSDGRSAEGGVSHAPVRANIAERLAELAAEVAEIRTNTTRAGDAEAGLWAELGQAREEAAGLRVALAAAPRPGWRRSRGASGSLPPPWRFLGTDVRSGRAEGRAAMRHEERWIVTGLLALAARIYALAWLFGGPATYLDPAPPLLPPSS